MDGDTLKLALKTLPAGRAIVEEHRGRLQAIRIPLLVRKSAFRRQFDPAPAVDNRFVAAAMKADPAAFGT
jgi:hypothetical protein